MPGIFLARGFRFDLPEMEIEILPDGTWQGPSSIALRITADMYPQWLRIALERTFAAEGAAKKVDEIWSDGVPEEQVVAIEAELRESMLAILACAAAFDGLFGTIADIAPLEPAVVATWRRNRTRRDARICEAMRRRFKLGPHNFANIKPFMRLLFRLRNEAIHPVSKTHDPLQHPRLPVAVEKRFVMFRAENAYNATLMSLRIFSALSRSPRSKFEKLVEHCGFAREWMDDLRLRWEKAHEPLFPDNTSRVMPN